MKRSLLSILLLLVPTIAWCKSPPHPPVPTWEGPATIIDGDMITIGGELLRLRGIDAPEIGQTCKKRRREYECGAEAKAALLQIIDSRPLRCRGRQIDKYGRPLVECYTIPDCTLTGPVGCGGRDVNREMVKRGLAVAYASREYEWDEEIAERYGRGLWAGTFDRPYQWRRMHRK